MSRNEEFVQMMCDGYESMASINLNEARTYERLESEASTLVAWEVNV